MPLNLAAIPALRAALMDAVEAAAADVILARSNALIPVDTGAARASGRVVREGDTTYVTYGRDDDGTSDHAPSNDYIAVLHENLAAHHPIGQAKFLQTAGDEAASVFVAAVAAKVKR